MQRAFWVWLLFLPVLAAHGQIPTPNETPAQIAPLTDSTKPMALAAIPDTTFQLSFRNARIGFNSFVFQNRGSYRHVWGKHQARVVAGQDFLYNQNLTQRGGRFVQQDYYWLADYAYALNPNWQLGGQSAGYLFAVNGNRLMSNSVRARRVLDFGPISNGTLELRTGLASDRRGEFADNGPLVGGQLVLHNQYPDSTLQLALLLQAHQAYIAPRQNRLLTGSLTAQKQFGDRAQLLGHVQAHTRLVEDYLSGIIQSIRSDTVQLNVQFSTELFSGLYLRSANQLLMPNRQFTYRARPGQEAIRQNTRFEQLEINTRQELGWAFGRIQQSLALEISQRTRAYQVENNLGLQGRDLLRAETSEQSKDIQEFGVGWYYQGAFAATRRSSFNLNTVAKLFRLSTPSVLNDQDRDEALYTADLSWTHRWFSNFRTIMRGSGSLKQMVFTTATQSAQNFTERIARFEPRVQWQQGPLSWQAGYSIWATYNVRDFAQEQGKNRSNRILILQHNLQYQLSRQLRLGLDFLRRENRIAQLNWERFAEAPLDTVIIHEWHPRVSYALPKQVLGTAMGVALGYKSFHQQRRYEGGVITPGQPTRLAYLRNITWQHGPWGEVTMLRGNNFRFSAELWTQWAVTRFEYKTAEEPFVGQSLSQADLDRVDRKLYWFLTVQGAVLF